MNVVSRPVLEKAKREYPNARKALDRWYDVARNSVWASPDDIKRQFPHASILSNNRIVFNVQGNSYRLVVGVSYTGGQVFIKWFGTHAEYSKKTF